MISAKTTDPDSVKQNQANARALATVDRLLKLAEHRTALREIARELN